MKLFPQIFGWHKDLNVAARGRYLFIDGCRAVAFFLVLLDHTYDFYHRYVFPHAAFPKPFVFLGHLGHEGVVLFYMISGFLITGVMTSDFSKDINIKNFYMHRILKIIPLYLVVVAASYWACLLFGIYRDYSDSLYLNSFSFLPFLLPAFVPINVHPIFSHFGTLTIEVHFYTYYPLIASFIFWRLADPEKRRKALLVTVLVLMLASWLYQGWWSATGGQNACSEYLYWDNLLLGCALKLLEPNYARLKENIRGVLSTVCFFLACVVVYFSTRMMEGNLVFNGDFHARQHVVLVLLFFAAYFRFLPLCWALENPVIRWIGKISYALYLWHYLLRYVFAKMLVFYPNSLMLNLLSYWAATFILAAVSTYTVERYFLGFGVKFPYMRPKPQAAAA